MDTDVVIHTFLTLGFAENREIGTITPSSPKKFWLCFLSLITSL